MSESVGGDPGRLNGWKEIAGHLGKGSRTVQRWEKLYGLPVHRLGREGGEIVYAFREEIDGWMASSARERATDEDAPATAPRAGGRLP
jgi:phage terminase Nu1 subunit (DNA packaging protein)